jgi:hypothetical protein
MISFPKEDCGMWAVKNHTPYAVGRAWGRDKDGVHEWIVAVKATFNIKPNGELVLADEQPKPLLAPEYNGEDGVSSLRYDAEIVSLKPTTDVVLNGTAYAPKGRPATEFLVSLRVGSIHKQIKVVGNRRWEKGLLGSGRSAMEPVTKVPIVYERAYGGFDRSDPDPKKQRMEPRNPVGCGLVAQVGQALPNFESLGWGKSGPAGFGAIDSYWSPRLELQGTYDDAWKKSRFPLLPADCDPRSLLCSPADQRPAEHMRGGELVELENLTPSGKLSFVLPKLHFVCRTRFTNRTEEHQSRLAAVIIEPDHPRVILVWQSVLAVRNDGDYLDETIVTAKE